MSDYWVFRWASALSEDSPKQMQDFSELIIGVETPSMKWWALFISLLNDDDPRREILKSEILLAVDSVEGEDRRPSISEVALRANPELARALANPLVPTEVHLDDPFRIGEALTQIMVNANLVIKNVEHKHRHPSSDIMISADKCGDLLTNAAAIFDAVKGVGRNMGDDDHSVLKHYAGIALYSACAFLMFSLARDVKVLSDKTGTDGRDSPVVKMADEFELYRLWPDGEWSELVIHGWLVRSMRFMETPEFDQLTPDVQDAVKRSVKKLKRGQNHPLEEQRLRAYQTHRDLISSCGTWFGMCLEDCWNPHSEYDAAVFDYFQAFHALHNEGVHGRFSEEVEFVSMVESHPDTVRAHIERDIGFSGTYRGGSNASNASDEEQRCIQKAVKHNLLKANMQRHNHPYVIRFFIQMFIDVQEEDRGFRVYRTRTEDVQSRAACAVHQSTVDDIVDLKPRGLSRVDGKLTWLYPKVAVGASADAILRFNPSVMQTARRANIKHNRKNSQASQTSQASQASQASGPSGGSGGSGGSYVNDFWSQRAKEYGKIHLERRKIKNNVISFGSQADERKVNDAGWAFNIMQRLAKLSQKTNNDPDDNNHLSGDTSNMDGASAPERRISFACLYTI
jgi:hypothetical protein